MSGFLTWVVLLDVSRFANVANDYLMTQEIRFTMSQRCTVQGEGNTQPITAAAAAAGALTAGEGEEWRGKGRFLRLAEFSRCETTLGDRCCMHNAQPSAAAPAAAVAH